MLKALLADGISLTHSVRVFSSLSQAAQRTADVGQIVELMRTDLGTLLVGNICGPDQRLPVITLAAQLEEMVVGGMQDPTTGEIVIEPDLARSIGERIAALLRERPQGALTPALVVQPRARRALAGLLKLRAPNVLVLSINELPAAQPIEVVSVIGDEAEQVAHQQTPQLPPPAHDSEMYEQEALAA